MARFKIFKSTTNAQYYFRFVANNGEQILSSEGYTTKDNCKNGIRAVQTRAPFDATYQRQDVVGNYRFNMLGSNGEIVARSSEGYTTRQNRENAITLVKNQAPGAGTDDLT